MYNYTEEAEFNAIPDLNEEKDEIKAQSLADPSWSEHKLALGAKDEEDDVPKLLTEADVIPAGDLKQNGKQNHVPDSFDLS